MFKKTGNPYKFQYLITGITGPGIPHVYLPMVPKDKDILFKKEQKFIRPEMPDYLVKACTEMLYQRAVKDKSGSYVSPNWIHPKYQEEINAWEEREHDRCDNGIFFWNDGVITYMTGFYYWYLTSIRTYFGRPDYRETDKEITYWIQYFEEDPDCYGGAFNTIRRYGKSVLMGAWALYRATRNFNHFCGMQGESDDKIKKFYNKFIKKPFLKLPYYHKPTYNTSTQLTNQIEFDIPPRRNAKNYTYDEIDSLESVIEYRESSEGAYDGDVIHTYLMEEPGKTKKASIYNDEGEGRWDVVLPCLSDGLDVIGKAFFGTTVENLNVKDKGGAAYKKLFYDSDFDQKSEDGRTKSGLYTAFLPGDCALKGYWDSHGRPLRAKAREALLRRRAVFKRNPSKLAGLIRKYPLSIRDIFYINPTACEFNAKVLQERRDEIDMTTTPMYNRFDLYWKNGRFSEVGIRHNPENGWFKAAWLPTEAKDLNKVRKGMVGGLEKYFPLNDTAFAIGMDPIDHGIITENRISTNGAEDANIGRRSRPVLFVKSKYNSAIDGATTQEEFEARAQPGKMVNGQWVLDDSGAPYQYQTNRYFGMMDSRPYDPNVLYERTLMICWLFGCSLHVESQKPGVIRYFYEWNCEAFILSKYVPVDIKNRTPFDDGTAASTTIIQEYTGEISAYVEYFGHTLCFIEQIDDLLMFNARKTTEFDYTVATGFTELSCKMKPRQKERPMIDIGSMMPTFDQFGNRTN